LADGHAGLHNCSVGIRSDGENAAELAQALIHTTNTNAQSGKGDWSEFAEFGRKALAPVPHFKLGGVVGDGKTNFGGGALRVTVNVGQALLKDPEQGKLDVLGKAYVTGNFVCGVDAATFRERARGGRTGDSSKTGSESSPSRDIFVATRCWPTVSCSSRPSLPRSSSCILRR